jgi:FkbM family methyltransferase
MELTSSFASNRFLAAPHIHFWDRVPPDMSFSSRLKGVLKHLLDSRVYTIRRGVAAGLRRKGGIGFLPQRVLVAEHRFFLARDFAGQTVYDVGGNEGVLTLFFARAVGPTGRVLVFEPNPRSFAFIEENLRLNSFHNVAAYQLGLGAEIGLMALTFPEGEPGRGTLRSDAAALLRRKHGSAIRTASIPIDTLDHVVATQRLPDPSFVKIDVEGLECDVLSGMLATMERCRPEVFVELYGIGEANKIEGTRCALAIFRSFQYSVRHVESGRLVDDPDGFVPVEGHLYATPSAAISRPAPTSPSPTSGADSGSSPMR